MAFSLTPYRPCLRGLTLVECLAGLGVLAALASVAAPGLDELIQTRRLLSVAALLEADLHHARSLALARQATLRFELRQGVAEGGSCYVVHAGRPGDCPCASSPAALCRDGLPPLRSVPLDPSTQVWLRASAASFVFEPLLGAATPATSIELGNARGGRARLVVNATGRVRHCAPGEPLPGWPAC